MLVRYRDINGYIIKPPKIPIVPWNTRTNYSGYVRAQHVWCSKIAGLQHVLNCKKCEHCKGTKKWGLNCDFEPAIKAPECYNQ